MPSDSPTELDKFCKDHGVHEILYQALALKGLESVDDFAYAFPEIRSLEALLSGLSETDLTDMGATDQYHGVQAARIRKALRFAHDLCQQPSEPTQPTPQPPSLPAAILPQASPASWVENLPPKLSQEAAQELIDDFKTNYPGELLDEDTMPNIRLLSLVQHSLKPGPTTQELLAADRKIWGTIGTLVSAGWSLDEALYEERASQDPQPTPALGPPLVAGQEEEGLPGRDSNVATDTATQHPTDQCPPPKTISFRRRKARQQEKFDPPQVLLLDTSGPLGARCKALADPEAIPFLELTRAPREQESRLMLQCLWSRSIIAIIASLPVVAPQEELAISLMQAIEASAAIAILTVPRDHSFLRCPELAACLHDASFHMCPSPRHGEVILASTMGRISKLPLRLGHITEVSYASLLKTSGPLLPTALPYAMAPAHLARRTTAYHTPRASAKPPKHGYNGHRSPTYPTESSHTSAKAAQNILSRKRSNQKHWRQPFRLKLMQALAELTEDPDQDLPSILAEGKLSLVKAEGRDPRLVLDSAVCQVNPLCRIPEAVTMPTVQEVRRSSYQLEEGLRGRQPNLSGWKFNFAYETVELCAAKRLKLSSQIEGHTWIRISDPSCPVIKMTRAAQSSLAWLAPRIAAIPTTPLSLPPILSSLARADAMAEGNQVGMGGWVSTKHGLAWFAETYTMEEIRSFWPFLTKDAQKYIACFESLAQLALAMTAKAHLGHTRLSLCLPTESDNTPTEGGVNKLFTTAWSLSEFLSLIASWSSANGISIQVSHIAGAHNEWADDLSRGRLQAFAHRSRDRFRVSLDVLASASAQASWSSKDPTEVSPIAELSQISAAVGVSYMRLF
ncbi:unnamed protein product [Symbiodinium sp. KB8]|nr:unnamed protein product [Symbiodinium sp. KB8]